MSPPRKPTEHQPRAGVGESKVFYAILPGDAPGSKAIYEKTVDVMGKTIQYYKTTIDPEGIVVDIADKVLNTKWKIK